MTGVLDWELAHLGDPVEDLGWLCVPAWRFTRPDRPAGRPRHARAAARGVCAPRRRRGGRRRAALVGARGHAALGRDLRDAGVHPPRRARCSSVEHAVIGRRACEVEWDLLELLDPAASPSAGGRASARRRAKRRRAAARPPHGGRAARRRTRGARRRRAAPARGSRGIPAARVAAGARDGRTRAPPRRRSTGAARAAALATLGMRDEGELARRSARGASTGASGSCLRRCALSFGPSSRSPTPPTCATHRHRRERNRQMEEP